MLAEPPKNLPLFESSEVDLSLQLPLKWNNVDERIIPERSWSKKRLKLRQKSASCPPCLSELWINAIREATVPLIWPSLRLSLLGTFKMSPPKKLKTRNSHTSHVQKIARLPNRNLGRRKRRNTTASKLKKTLGLPQSLVLIWLKLMEGPAKTRARSAATIAPKRDIIQGIVWNSGRMHQKTSNGLGNLHVKNKG